MSSEFIPFDEYEAVARPRARRPWFQSHTVIRAWQLNLVAATAAAALVLSIVK